MSYIDTWKPLWKGDPESIKYGKVTNISNGDNITIQFGARIFYSKYDKVAFPDLNVGDQVAFLSSRESPQNTFILRKVSMKYLSIASNFVVD